MRILGPLFMLLAVLWVVPALHADAAVKVGSAAPPLTFRELLQAPDGTRGTWEQLNGRAVVLEFWATWCGGCVDNIPHLNELVEKFKSLPIQFISITDETDIDLVKRFLARHPISGWVAFDAEEATFKNYGVEGRPRTFLVDRNGVVQAITNPPSVTPQVLEDLLAGKSLNFPEVRMGPLLGLEPNAPPPLLQVLIRPAAPVGVSGSSPGGVIEKDGRYDAYGETLRQILSEAYEVPETRVDAPEWCKQTRYDFSVVTPQHDEALRWPLVKQALEAAFRLKLHREIRETRVYVLKLAAGLQPKLRPATTAGKSSHWLPGKGQVEAIGASINTVTYTAEFVLGEEILDETGFGGRYDFDLTWDPNQPNSFVAAIHDQLGLDLVAERRKLEHLVVDSITETKTW